METGLDGLWTDIPHLFACRTYVLVTASKQATGIVIRRGQGLEEAGSRGKGVLIKYLKGVDSVAAAAAAAAAAQAWNRRIIIEKGKEKKRGGGL